MDKKTKRKKFIRNIFIAFMALGLVLCILKIAPDYMNKDIKNKTNFVINNKNITSSLKNDIIFENDICYVSEPDVKNFFDKYIYYDEGANRLITTYEDKIASIEIGKNVMNLNGKDVNIAGSVIVRNNIRFLPFTQMSDAFNAQMEYIPKTDTLVLETLDRQRIEATATKKLSVKYKEKVLSRTVDKVQKDETVIIIDEEDDGWTKVRTHNGKIGYVKTSDLSESKEVRAKREEQKYIDGKVNMVWDYYSEYATAPDRSGTSIQGVNVVSPSFFSLVKLGKGEFIDKVGEEGLDYIKWAHSNGYQVWPMFANESMIETTSEIMRDYVTRQKTIENIISLATKYDIDGINIDFENMYKEDIDLFSRFIIELYPRARAEGLALSVDVTAPDGSDTWSMCFDRNVIADNCDYIVFMAYDQYGASSDKAGTTAGLNWVKLSLNKFLETEVIEPEKIILGIPFYTRLWEERPDGTLKTSVVTMENIDRVLANQGMDIERVWKEDVGQHYVEYQKGNSTFKMWIEDEKSIREKIKLAVEKEIGGVAFWVKGMEDENIWKVIDEELNK